jgi:hypothetical protein
MTLLFWTLTPLKYAGVDKSKLFSTFTIGGFAAVLLMHLLHFDTLPNVDAEVDKTNKE